MGITADSQTFQKKTSNYLGNLSFVMSVVPRIHVDGNMNQADREDQRGGFIRGFLVGGMGSQEAPIAMCAAQCCSVA